MNGFNIGHQDIQRLQQQLQQQQQNLQNLQKLLLLQSTGQLGLPTNLQALLGLNPGVFSSNMMGQGIQNLAPSTITPSQAASSTNQTQISHQTQNQFNGQSRSPPLDPVTNQKQTNRDRNQPTHSPTAKTSVTKILQEFTPSNMNTNVDGVKVKMPNIGSTLTTNETKAATTLISSFPLRSRSEPSPEEMTDLEELEQFAKMFKQRRIKLGKFFP